MASLLLFSRGRGDPLIQGLTAQEYAEQVAQAERRIAARRNRLGALEQSIDATRGVLIAAMKKGS